MGSGTEYRVISSAVLLLGMSVEGWKHMGALVGFAWLDDPGRETGISTQRDSNNVAISGGPVEAVLFGRTTQRTKNVVGVDLN